MRFLSLFTFILLLGNAVAQDVEAEYPGGGAALTKYIMDSFVYPHQAIVDRAEGSVYLSFIVEVDGSLSSIKVLKSLHPSLDEEAVRLIQEMPTWNAGRQDNIAVRTQCRLPIRFHLTKKLKKKARKTERKKKRNKD